MKSNTDLIKPYVQRESFGRIGRTLTVLPVTPVFLERIGINSREFYRGTLQVTNNPENLSLTKASSNYTYVRDKELEDIRRIQLEIDEIVNNYREQGISPIVFSETLDVILSAIREQKNIKGINLSEKVQEQTFRFLTYDEPEISMQVADTFALFAEHVRQSVVKKGAKIRAKASGKKRSEKADAFVQNMYPVIEKLKTSECVSTYEDTVKMLNEKGVHTARGGKWHVKTLHALSKRYEKLSSPKV